MSDLFRRNRITTGQLVETLRGLKLRPEQRRIIRDVFSRYGDEGITRPEFEAGLYQLLNERRYQYTLKRRDIEAVRRSAFPAARPSGRPGAEPRAAGRPSVDEPRLGGGSPDAGLRSAREPAADKLRGRGRSVSGKGELPPERPRLRGLSHP